MGQTMTSSDTLLGLYHILKSKTHLPTYKKLAGILEYNPVAFDEVETISEVFIMCVARPDKYKIKNPK